jgi:hypothetical protein
MNDTRAEGDVPAPESGSAMAHEMPTSPLAAFPASLAPLVTRLIPLLDSASGLPVHGHIAVSCDGETLRTPYRIYEVATSDDLFGSLPPLDQCIAACWFTRHHNGYVRERFLRALPAFDQPWIIAHVVLLCGEYVVELLDYVWANRTFFDPDGLGRWLLANRALHARTRRRIISYWDCYHRQSHPDFKAYVGARLIAFFDDCLALVDPESTPIKNGSNPNAGVG